MAETAEMHQTVNSYVCLEWQSHETVFDPVVLIVSRVEGVVFLPALAALPHSPLLHTSQPRRSDSVSSLSLSSGMIWQVSAATLLSPRVSFVYLPSLPRSASGTAAASVALHRSCRFLSLSLSILPRPSRLESRAVTWLISATEGTARELDRRGR